MMYTTLLLSAICATSLSAPLAQASESTGWTPAAESTITCDKTSDKTVEFSQGLLLDTVLTNACTAMMPCAYPTRPANMVCTATIDLPLQEQMTSVQPANVQTSDGNKISGWNAKFTVTPPADQGLTGVRWRKDDCYGYFERILNGSEPAGCHGDAGSGAGSITVGGDGSLKGTMFEVSTVQVQ